MDREKAMTVFKAYAENYDTSDVKIRLKIDHTYRVAQFADRIGRSIGVDADFCWFLGLLHDIARFEQQTRYGTFVDAHSVDHAELGADILFRDGLIDRFEADFSGTAGIDDWNAVAEKAIRLHNKLNVPDDLDRTTDMYTRILRDADKIDIFRVLTEPPYDDRIKLIIEKSAVSPAAAREEVMECVRIHRCVPRTFERSEFEGLISSICMAFELNYDESRRMAKEQGYLDKLINIEVADTRMKAQMNELRAEMEKVL